MEEVRRLGQNELHLEALRIGLVAAARRERTSELAVRDERLLRGAAEAPNSAADGAVMNRTDGMMKDPTDGVMKVPTDGMMKVPTDGMMKVLKNRTDGMMKDPTDGQMKDPNGLVATTRRTRTPELAVRGERSCVGRPSPPPKGLANARQVVQRSRGGLGPPPSCSRTG